MTIRAPAALRSRHGFHPGLKSCPNRGLFAFATVPLGLVGMILQKADMVEKTFALCCRCMAEGRTVGIGGFAMQKSFSMDFLDGLDAAACFCLCLSQCEQAVLTCLSLCKY